MIPNRKSRDLVQEIFVAKNEIAGIHNELTSTDIVFHRLFCYMGKNNWPSYGTSTQTVIIWSWIGPLCKYGNFAYLMPPESVKKAASSVIKICLQNANNWTVCFHTDIKDGAPCIIITYIYNTLYIYMCRVSWVS